MACYSIYLFWFAGLMTDELRSFLELNLPKVKEGKKPKFSLGVAEPKLGSHIFEETKIPCQSNEFVLELLRGVRLHFERFIKDLKVCTLHFFMYIFTPSCSWITMLFLFFNFLFFRYQRYISQNAFFLFSLCFFPQPCEL